MRQLKISQKITNRESQALEKYLSEISKIDTLSPEEEVELTKRIKSGDQLALDQLVKANLRFVVSVAKHYSNNGLSLNDLINEGNVGLLKAARRFDETKGFKFITFAVWWIRQSILAAIIENSRMIRLPYNKFHSQKQITDKYQAFMQQYEREPSIEELSEILGLKADDIYWIQQSSNRMVSLDAPVDGDEGGYNISSLIEDDSLDAPDLNLMKHSMKEELKLGMMQLSPREREILSSLYGLKNNVASSLEDISQNLGISIERVRQVRDHAVRRLRRYYLKHNIKPFSQ